MLKCGAVLSAVSFPKPIRNKPLWAARGVHVNRGTNPPRHLDDITDPALLVFKTLAPRIL
jgi:hypothetical protein